jgi:hypothetical protein
LLSHRLDQDVHGLAAELEDRELCFLEHSLVGQHRYRDARRCWTTQQTEKPHCGSTQLELVTVVRG